MADWGRDTAMHTPPASRISTKIAGNEGEWWGKRLRSHPSRRRMNYDSVNALEVARSLKPATRHSK